MRVALIHDWLFRMRGGEHVLEMFCAMFPQADLFALFHRKDNLAPLIAKREVTASCLNSLPGVQKYYRSLLPFYPIATWDLGRKMERKQVFSNYDLVISISHCAAKNVSVPDSCYHISYCLTPMRYVWDQYDAYFGRNKLEPLIRPFAAALRSWDKSRAAGVDRFVGISKFVAQRIERVYGRPTDVVYPPVSTEWLRLRKEGQIGEGFLCVNALVPYKNTHIVVEAFNELGHKLKVVGSGPELEHLRSIARENIEFIPFVSDSELSELYRNSKALVFAAEEDFGMSPVEMQASGRPVIALAKGGSVETVTDSPEHPTGVFFRELSVSALVSAVKYFLDREADFTVNNCIEQARMFSVSNFEKSFCHILAQSGLSANVCSEFAQVTSRHATTKRVILQRQG